MTTTAFVIMQKKEADAPLVFGLLDGSAQNKGLQLIAWPTDESVLLPTLQQWVGGRVEACPHDPAQASSAPPLTAYANERGISLCLPPNPMAWHVLRDLGFVVSPKVTLYGPVLLLDDHDRPLSLAHQALIQKAVHKYRARFSSAGAVALVPHVNQ